MSRNFHRICEIADLSLQLNRARIRKYLRRDDSGREGKRALDLGIGIVASRRVGAPSAATSAAAFIHYETAHAAAVARNRAERERKKKRDSIDASSARRISINLICHARGTMRY